MISGMLGPMSWLPYLYLLAILGWAASAHVRASVPRFVGSLGLNYFAHRTIPMSCVYEGTRAQATEACVRTAIKAPATVAFSSSEHSGRLSAPSVARVYILARCRFVARVCLLVIVCFPAGAMATKGTKCRKGEGVSSKLNPKPRINKTGKGYRVFKGRHYMACSGRRGKRRHALARIIRRVVRT